MHVLLDFMVWLYVWTMFSCELLVVYVSIDCYAFGLSMMSGGLDYNGYFMRKM